MRNSKTYFILLLLITSLLFTGCSINNSDGGKEDGQNGPSAGQQNGTTEIPDGNYDTDDGNDNDNSNDNSNDGESKAPLEENGATDDEDKIISIIEDMSLDEKIGQMFIVGFEGTSMNSDLENMITSKSPGGVILFQRNINDSQQLHDLTNSIKQVNSGHIPLFISVDEEGGIVSRMPPDLNDLPSANSIGELNDIHFSYSIGGLLAEEIKSFGFNMDFAPVLDIWSNPKNTVIGERSFGTSAETVSKHGIQVLKGIRENGVIPVVKHFPGHGDTEEDSHIGLPEVDHEIDRLNDFELVPFQRAIDANVDVVMVAHILMSSVDSEYPATMSRNVITDILRNQMGFAGVVITDDMTMGAIAKNYGIGEAAIKSVEAGSDIILVCHGYDNQSEAIAAVKEAVETGAIPEARIDESVERILKLKDRYGLTDHAIEYADADSINKKIDGVLAKWYNR